MKPKRKVRLAEIFELIEDGTLVRDVSRDHESDWSIRALKLTMTLKKAQAALASPATTDGPEGG